jgi:hypothetical protein
VNVAEFVFKPVTETEWSDFQQLFEARGGPSYWVGLTPIKEADLVTKEPAGRLLLSKRFKFLCAVAAACVPACGAATEAAAAGQPILWSDLRPAGTAATRPETSSPTVQPEHDGALSWNLQGKMIELAGYALPVDRDGDLVYEFMLLPLTGMCSHVPPPPPNQVVLVTPEKPFRMSGAYEPVSVSGVLKPGLEKTQLFILDGVTVIKTGYSVGRAQVTEAESVPGTIPSTGTTPWKFLKK